MRDKIQSKEVITLREIIEKGRERFKQLAREKPTWWNDPSSSNWARKLFGDDLNAPINNDTIESEIENCQICGRDFILDEKFLHLGFSFCDEYACEMNICKQCLSKLERGVK